MRGLGPFLVPREPSIAGFILISLLLGLVTTRPDPLRVVVASLIYLHLIFTVDRVFYAHRLLDKWSLYGVISNALLFLYTAYEGGLGTLYAIGLVIPLLLTTLIGVRIWGRKDPLVLISGTLMFTLLPLHASSYTGGMTQLSIYTTGIYSLYTVISVLYVEARVGRIGPTLPLALALTSYILLSLAEPIAGTVFIDPLAKTAATWIRRDVIPIEQITSLGKRETLRLFLHTPLFPLAGLLLT